MTAVIVCFCGFALGWLWGACEERFHRRNVLESLEKVRH